MTLLEFPRTGILDVQVTNRMIWPGTIQTHASLSEAALSYASEPLWEFDLQYNGLREGNWEELFYDELSRIEGLFGNCGGSTLGFKYRHPQRNTSTRQLIATTDGATSTFDLVRMYGPPSVPALQGTERIGVLNTDEVPFHLYVDGGTNPVRTDDATYGYSLSTDTPGLQQIVFAGTPPSGHQLYVDMGYFYYARFKESTFEYDRLCEGLYKAGQVTIRTKRAELL